MVRHHRQAIGVDIGGTATKIAVIHDDGEVLHYESLPTKATGDPAQYLANLKHRLKKLVSDFEPSGIGLALPGFLSENRSTIVFNPNTPSLVGFDFYGQMVDLGMPLAFEQDLNVPSLAEYHFGERQGVGRLLTASIGTGLGASMVIQGELLRYFGAIAGDNGHIILQPGGPQCTAGCSGCAEALIAAPAIERLFKLMEPKPELVDLHDTIQSGTPIPRAVIQAAAQGDPVAGGIIQTIGSWLGQWLASLGAVYMPDVIILCGGVSMAGEILRYTAETRMRELGASEYTHAEVRLGKFGGNTGVIGAAVPFLRPKG